MQGKWWVRCIFVCGFFCMFLFVAAFTVELTVVWACNMCYISLVLHLLHFIPYGQFYLFSGLAQTARD